MPALGMLTSPCCSQLLEEQLALRCDLQSSFSLTLPSQKFTVTTAGYRTKDFTAIDCRTLKNAEVNRFVLAGDELNVEESFARAAID